MNKRITMKKAKDFQQNRDNRQRAMLQRFDCLTPYRHPPRPLRRWTKRMCEYYRTVDARLDAGIFQFNRHGEIARKREVYELAD